MNYIFDSEKTINASVQDRMFRLRKQVFCDTLGWDIPHCSGKEADIYDFIHSYYMNLIDPSTGTLMSSVRLIPFNSDNLMSTVFKQSIESNCKTDRYQSNRVWEGTRLCINEKAIPAKERPCAMIKLLVGLFQTCKIVGIERLMCNCNSVMLRLYRSQGLVIDKIGSTDEFRHGVVHCIAFDISPLNFQVLSDFAEHMNIAWPEIEGRGIESARKFTQYSKTEFPVLYPPMPTSTPQCNAAI